MDNNNSLGFLLWKLFLMSLSLAIPLIMIGTSGWIITLVTVIVFATALSGRVGIAYIYRMLHNILLRPGLYIWALIVTIAGPQDVVAIGFYVVFACQAMNIISNFIGEVIALFSFFAENAQKMSTTGVNSENMQVSDRKYAAEEHKKFAEYNKPITKADVDVIQNIAVQKKKQNLTLVQQH